MKASGNFNGQRLQKGHTKEHTKVKDTISVVRRYVHCIMVFQKVLKIYGKYFCSIIEVKDCH